MAGAKEKLLSTLKQNLARMGADVVAGQEAPGARDTVESIQRLEEAVKGEEAAADEPQAGMEDKQRATLDEWRNLSAATCIPLVQLQRKVGLIPKHCKLSVYREGPMSYSGKPILTGRFPDYTYDFPFDLMDIEKQVCAVLGGGKYRFQVYDHTGRLVGEKPVSIALPPKNPPTEEEPPPEEEAPATPPPEMFVPRPDQSLSPAEIESMIQERVEQAREATNREFDLRTELAELRRTIAQVASKPSSNGDGVQVLVQSMQNNTQTMMEGLKMVVQGMGEKLAGVQQSQVQSVELMMKMADARANAQAEIAKVQLEASKSSQELLYKVLGDRQHTDELKADRVLDILQMGMGFAERLQRPPEGEGGKEGWLEEGLKGLINVFANKAVEAQRIPQVQLPPGQAEAPALTPEEAETQRKYIEATAARAAARIAEKVKARNAVLKARQEAAKARAAQAAASVSAPPAPGGLAAPAAPPPPPPPVGGLAAPAAPSATAPAQGPEDEVTELTEAELDEAIAEGVEEGEAPELPADPEQAKRTVLSNVLKLVLQEADAKPPLSTAVRYALKYAPPDWVTKFISTQNAIELGEFFRPYADPALVEAVKSRAKSDPKMPEWLTYQAGLLQAYLKQMVARSAQQAQPAGKEGQS